MTPKEIESLGPELADFLSEFSECFGRSEPRNKLAIYIRGQLSDMDRKSAEPIALDAGISPRSLQEFLGSDQWDEKAARNRMAQIVARDHADPEAIGIIDESGHPKKGSHTACVQRQYCGNTGKIDNCVVTVHLAYAAYNRPFRTLLDSTLFLPEQSWTDPQRRQKAGIPDDVVYRPKHRIALEQIDRALGNGVVFSWITADEWYTQRPTFLQGLEDRGLRYYQGQFIVNHDRWFLPEISEERQSPFRARVSTFWKCPATSADTASGQDRRRRSERKPSRTFAAIRATPDFSQSVIENDRSCVFKFVGQTTYSHARRRSHGCRVYHGCF